MELLPIQSTNIEAAGYDPSIQLLRVQFRGGKLYDYDAVLPNVYAEFLSAPSKGQFINARLRNRGVTQPGNAIYADLTLPFIAEDECCGVALGKALAGNRAPVDQWTHRKCGAEWRRTIKPDGSVLWHPVTIIQIF